MYDQGQVSTSIYYQNDKYGWPKTLRSERGGQVESIKRDKGYIPNSILQLEQVSNDHLATRQLTLSHAIPLPVKTDQQLQQPFRFFVEDMKNMSTQDRVNFVQQGFTYPQQLDGLDDYLITFFDLPNRPTLPRIYPGNTIVSYYRMLYTSLAYLDIYLPEKSPKFATLSQNGSSLQAMMESVRDYYRVCMDMEREYLKDDKCESVFTLLNLFPVLGSPSTNYLVINRKLKSVYDDCVSQPLTRTSAYFVFRLLPRIPAIPLIDHALVQKIMGLLVPIFTQPRGQGFTPSDPMEAENYEVTDEELLMARFDNELEKKRQQEVEQDKYKRARLAWLLEHQYEGFNDQDRKLLAEYNEAQMQIDSALPRVQLGQEPISNEEAQQRLNAITGGIQIEPISAADEAQLEDDMKQTAAMEVDKKLPKTAEQKLQEQLVKDLTKKTENYAKKRQDYVVYRMEQPKIVNGEIWYPISYDDLLPLKDEQTVEDSRRYRNERYIKADAIKVEVLARLCKLAGKRIYVKNQTGLFGLPRAEPVTVDPLVEAYSLNTEFMQTLHDIFIKDAKGQKDLISALRENIDLNYKPPTVPDYEGMKDAAKKRKPIEAELSSPEQANFVRPLNSPPAVAEEKMEE